ncbi:unnamed protein product, partial [Ixodes persulcatus]
MEFHPGGEEELMRGVGKDATDLFIQVHKWVNFESMLEKCLVGRLVGPPANSIRKCVSPLFFSFLAFILLPMYSVYHSFVHIVLDSILSCYEWSQDDSTVTIVVQCKGDYAIEDNKVGTDLSGKKLRIRVRVSKFLYLVHIGEFLPPPLCLCMTISAAFFSFLVSEKQLFLEKCYNSPFVPKKELAYGYMISFQRGQNESFSRTCTLVDKSSITHDVFLFTFALPAGSLLWVPIGHHISLEHDVRGTALFLLFE